MKKCMQCGGATKKMAKGGSVAAGIPYASGAGATDGKNGMMRKGGAVKKMQTGGATNAQKVAANKKKVAANAKKVQTNREKVALGKYSPNSAFTSKSGAFTTTNNKGDVDYKHNGSFDKNINKFSNYQAFPWDKPRTVVETTKPGQSLYKVKSATSMDTTGYAAGKKTFVKNTKTAVGSGGNAYKQTSKKVARKDVPKTLAEMQKMKKGGMVKNAKLAALAAPKNKITRADVIVGAKRNAKKK